MYNIETSINITLGFCHILNNQGLGLSATALIIPNIPKTSSNNCLKSSGLMGALTEIRTPISQSLLLPHCVNIQSFKVH